MSHESYDSNLGSKRLILFGDIRSRSRPNIGDSYGKLKKELGSFGWFFHVSSDFWLRKGEFEYHFSKFWLKIWSPILFYLGLDVQPET